MGTKQIPVIIMLVGGCVSCVTSLVREATMHNMLIALIITLIVFYILGHIIRIVINKFFANILSPEEEESGEMDTENQEEGTVERQDNMDTEQDEAKASENMSSEDGV